MSFWLRFKLKIIFNLKENFDFKRLKNQSKRYFFDPHRDIYALERLNQGYFIKFKVFLHISDFGKAKFSKSGRISPCPKIMLDKIKIFLLVRSKIQAKIFTFQLEFCLQKLQIWRKRAKDLKISYFESNSQLFTARGEIFSSNYQI